MTEQLWDSDLGEIIIVRDARAKKIIARWRDNAVRLTLPVSYPISKIKATLEKMKPRLLQFKPQEKQLFDENYKLTTFTFDVRIIREKLANYYVNLKDSVLNIICPQDADLAHPDIQYKIRTYIENVLRSEAKRILPLILQEHANKNGFTYSEVKINKSRTHWGSCTSRKLINLSYYCLLLPPHLIDYVLLHELCHTVEMNHSEKFWNLLDKVSDGKAKSLTQELKKHKTDF